MNYYDHVANLPDKLREINDHCWDFSGRPKCLEAYEICLGLLCAVSDNWQEFEANCDKFFFDYYNIKQSDLRLAWLCYYKGVGVAANKFESMISKKCGAN